MTSCVLVTLTPEFWRIFIQVTALYYNVPDLQHLRSQCVVYLTASGPEQSPEILPEATAGRAAGAGEATATEE